MKRNGKGRGKRKREKQKNGKGKAKKKEKGISKKGKWGKGKETGEKIRERDGLKKNRKGIRFLEEGVREGFIDFW